MRWLRFHTCWTFILCWGALFLVGKCDVLIIRKVNTKDTYHRDRFNIRRSKCTDIRQGNKCGLYGGFERSPNNPCKCLCPPRRGTITKEDNQWFCRNNEALRQRQECGLRFLYESSDSFLKMVTPNQWLSFIAPNSDCSQSTTRSSYLSCSGSWVPIPNMAKHVDVVMQGFDPVARSFAYQIKIKKKLPVLAGKLVKLYLDCASFGGSPCLLFKISGKQKCFAQTAKKIKKNDRNNIDDQYVKSPSSQLITESNLIPKKHPRYNWTLINDQRLLMKNKRTRITGDNSKAHDRKITTLILTSAAVVLGLVVLGLAINLCFCSNTQESQKGKHIFRRCGLKGNTTFRPSSDATSTPNILSLPLDTSATSSGGFISLNYESENDGLLVDGESFSNSLSNHEGVS